LQNASLIRKAAIGLKLI